MGVILAAPKTSTNLFLIVWGKLFPYTGVCSMGDLMNIPVCECGSKLGAEGWCENCGVEHFQDNYNKWGYNDTNKATLKRVYKVITEAKKTMASKDCLFNEDVKEHYIWCLNDLEKELREEFVNG